MNHRSAHWNALEARKKAVALLTKRYHEQCLKFPLTRDHVTLEEYVRVNLPYAVNNLKEKL
jgi:hypothetical protein